MPRPRIHFPPLPDLFAEFAAHQRRRGMEPWTMQKRRYRISHIAAFHAPRHVLTLGTEDLERWLDSLGISARTRATYVSEIRVFYAWAADDARYIRSNPARALSVPRRRRYLPRPIPDVELATALAEAEPRLLAILALMAYEGLRCVEVSRLRGEDVDARLMVLRVERGKGGKQRVVPLHPETLAALRAYRLPAKGPVFVPTGQGGHDTGKPLRPGTISDVVSAGLPGAYTAHQLRHWFGTHFYQLCKDLLLTQQVMGHEQPSTTAVYAAADTSAAAAVVRGLTVDVSEYSGESSSWAAHAPDPGPAQAAG